MTAQVLDRIVLQPGEALFKEGDIGDRAFVVQEGVIDIVKNATDGDVVLGSIEKGGIFGEMALISQSKRTATAITKMECELLYLGNDDFQQLLQDNQEISYNLCQLLSSRLASTNRLLGNKSKTF